MRGALRPQIGVALRLQVGELYHAALIGDDKAGQQVLQRYVLGMHSIDAGVGIEARQFQRREVLRRRRAGAGSVEGLQRRAVDHESDRDVLGSAHAVKVIADIAQHEADFVEVGKMIDDLGCVRLGRPRRLGECRGRQQDAGELQQITAAHGVLPGGPFGKSRTLSLAAHRRQFLAVGDERGAIAHARAVEPEHFVVGAGFESAGGFAVRPIALPDPNMIEPDDGGVIRVGEAYGYAAAVAIDVALEIDSGRQRHAVLRRNVRIGRIRHRGRMAAIAAGIEIAGPVAKIDAKPEGILEFGEIRVLFGADQKLHHADFLQRMLRQMRGIIAAHETGIGLRVRNAAGEHPIGEIVIGVPLGGRRRWRCQSRRRGNKAGGDRRKAQ